ncbi:hypothetical protein [Microlunatus aurantiacus]|uniref:hypothetical protein n=1 Tax=Microlunatus aurantiacus TaxID=446786 RepID=UPI0031D71F28
MSQKVMPSSIAWRKIGSPASSPSAHGIREPSPKLMHPRAILLTFNPDDPSRTCSTTLSSL